jgi:hypothetical protein
MANTEIGVGCSVLDIRSLFVGSKLVESRVLRSTAGVWEDISHTHPPVV